MDGDIVVTRDEVGAELARPLLSAAVRSATFVSLTARLTTTGADRDDDADEEDDEDGERKDSDDDNDLSGVETLYDVSGSDDDSGSNTDGDDDVEDGDDSDSDYSEGDGKEISGDEHNFGRHTLRWWWQLRRRQQRKVRRQRRKRRRRRLQQPAQPAQQDENFQQNDRRRDGDVERAVPQPLAPEAPLKAPSVHSQPSPSTHASTSAAQELGPGVRIEKHKVTEEQLEAAVARELSKLGVPAVSDDERYRAYLHWARNQGILEVGLSTFHRKPGGRRAGTHGRTGDAPHGDARDDTDAQSGANDDGARSGRTTGVGDTGGAASTAAYDVQTFRYVFLPDSHGFLVTPRALRALTRTSGASGGERHSAPSRSHWQGNMYGHSSADSDSGSGAERDGRRSGRAQSALAYAAKHGIRYVPPAVADPRTLHRQRQRRGAANAASAVTAARQHDEILGAVSSVPVARTPDGIASGPLDTGGGTQDNQFYDENALRHWSSDEATRKETRLSGERQRTSYSARQRPQLPPPPPPLLPAFLPFNAGGGGGGGSDDRWAPTRNERDHPWDPLPPTLAQGEGAALFRMLAESRVPIITYGGFFELMSLFYAFHAPLPGALDSFLEQCAQVMPHVVDLRYAARGAFDTRLDDGSRDDGSGGGNDNSVPATPSLQRMYRAVVASADVRHRHLLESIRGGRFFENHPAAKAMRRRRRDDAQRMPNVAPSGSGASSEPAPATASVGILERDGDATETSSGGGGGGGEACDTAPKRSHRASDVEATLGAWRSACTGTAVDDHAQHGRGERWKRTVAPAVASQQPQQKQREEKQREQQAGTHGGESLPVIDDSTVTYDPERLRVCGLATDRDQPDTAAAATTTTTATTFPNTTARADRDSGTNHGDDDDNDRSSETMMSEQFEARIGGLLSDANDSPGPSGHGGMLYVPDGARERMGQALLSPSPAQRHERGGGGQRRRQRQRRGGYRRHRSASAASASSFSSSSSSSSSSPPSPQSSSPPSSPPSSSPLVLPAAVTTAATPTHALNAVKGEAEQAQKTPTTGAERDGENEADGTADGEGAQNAAPLSLSSSISPSPSPLPSRAHAAAVEAARPSRGIDAVTGPGEARRQWRARRSPAGSAVRTPSPVPWHDPIAGDEWDIAGTALTAFRIGSVFAHLLERHGWRDTVTACEGRLTFGSSRHVVLLPGTAAATVARDQRVQDVGERVASAWPGWRANGNSGGSGVRGDTASQLSCISHEQPRAHAGADATATLSSLASVSLPASGASDATFHDGASGIISAAPDAHPFATKSSLSLRQPRGRQPPPVRPTDERFDRLLDILEPNAATERQRERVLGALAAIIKQSLNGQAFAYGSSATKTYLADSDMNVGAFVVGGAASEHGVGSAQMQWCTLLMSALCHESARTVAASLGAAEDAGNCAALREDSGADAHALTGPEHDRTARGDDAADAGEMAQSGGAAGGSATSKRRRRKRRAGKASAASTDAAAHEPVANGAVASIAGTALHDDTDDVPGRLERDDGHPQRHAQHGDVTAAAATAPAATATASSSSSSSMNGTAPGAHAPGPVRSVSCGVLPGRLGTPVVRCTIGDTDDTALRVCITLNPVAAMYRACFVAEVDEIVGRHHLFRRSLMLLKMWSYYATKGGGGGAGSGAGGSLSRDRRLIPTPMLTAMLLHLFNAFHSSAFETVSDVLSAFFTYFGKRVDWKRHSVSALGLLRVSDGALLASAVSAPAPLIPHELLERYARAAAGTDQSEPGDAGARQERGTSVAAAAPVTEDGEAGGHEKSRERGATASRASRRGADGGRHGEKSIGDDVRALHGSRNACAGMPPFIPGTWMDGDSDGGDDGGYVEEDEGRGDGDDDDGGGDGSVGRGGRTPTNHCAGGVDNDAGVGDAVNGVIGDRHATEQARDTSGGEEPGGTASPAVAAQNEKGRAAHADPARVLTAHSAHAHRHHAADGYLLHVLDPLDATTDIGTSHVGTHREAARIVRALRHSADGMAWLLRNGGTHAQQQSGEAAAPPEYIASLFGADEALQRALRVIQAYSGGGGDGGGGVGDARPNRFHDITDCGGGGGGGGGNSVDDGYARKLAGWLHAAYLSPLESEMPPAATDYAETATCATTTTLSSSHAGVATRRPREFLAWAGLLRHSASATPAGCVGAGGRDAGAATATAAHDVHAQYWRDGGTAESSSSQPAYPAPNAVGADDLTTLRNNVEYVRFLVDSKVSELGLLTFLTQVLVAKRTLLIGEIGQHLRATFGQQDWGAILKKRFGGLKRFLLKHASLFYVDSDHPLNPHIYLRARPHGPPMVPPGRSVVGPAPAPAAGAPEVTNGPTKSDDGGSGSVSRPHEPRSQQC